MVSAIAVQGHHLLISQEDFFDPDMYRKLLDFDKKLAEFNLSPEEEEKLRQEIRMEMEMKTGVDKSQQNFDLSEQQHEDLKRDIEHQARKKGLWTDRLSLEHFDGEKLTESVIVYSFWKVVFLLCK